MTHHTDTEAPAEKDTPSLNQACRTYLARWATGDTVHVYKTPDKPGSGVSRPALDKMLEAEVVELGAPVEGLGRPIQVTALGHRVLATATPTSR